jgi:hypothetical protein
LGSGFLALMAWTGALAGIDGFKMRGLSWLVEDVIVGGMGRGLGAALTACIGIVLAVAIMVVFGRSPTPTTRPQRSGNAPVSGGASTPNSLGQRRRVITRASIGENGASRSVPVADPDANAQESVNLDGLGHLYDQDSVARIQATRSPTLWHVTTIRTLVYQGNPYGFVQWVLQQPETDRATVAWIFLWARGVHYLRGETIAPTPHLTGDEVTALLRAVCSRSEQGGFSNDDLGLHKDYEAERLKCLAVMEKGELAPGIVAPTALLAKPFDPPRLDDRFFRWDMTLARLHPRYIPVSLDKHTSEFDITDASDVSRIKKHRDPALWHQAAMAALAYKGDPHGFLPWLVQQPKMDRATAGWIFLWAEGSRYLRGATEFSFNSGVRDAAGLLGSICERSHGMGFSNDALGLDRDFEAERLKCLAVIQNGELAPGIVAPIALLARPFDPPRHDGRFTLDDGLIICEETAQKG